MWVTAIMASNTGTRICLGAERRPQVLEKEGLWVATGNMLISIMAALVSSG